MPRAVYYSRRPSSTARRRMAMGLPGCGEESARTSQETGALAPRQEEERMRPGGLGLGVVLAVGMLMGPVREAAAQDPIHKAGRGLANVLACWVELPKQLREGLAESNPVAGAGKGLLKGLGLTAARLGLGAYESVTFPIPVPIGYSSPYEQFELRDFPWQE